MRLALLGVVFVLAGCNAPWIQPGQVLVETDDRVVLNEQGNVPSSLRSKYAQARRADGSIVVYERKGSCTNPNASYGLHAAAGNYECKYLYTSEAHEQKGSVLFRDWGGMAYTPNEHGEWVRDPQYDVLSLINRDGFESSDMISSGVPLDGTSGKYNK